MINWHSLGSPLHLRLGTKLSGYLGCLELFGGCVSSDDAITRPSWQRLRDLLNGIHTKRLKVQDWGTLILLRIVHYGLSDLLPKRVYFQYDLSLVDLICAEIEPTSKVAYSLRFFLDGKVEVDSLN